MLFSRSKSTAVNNFAINTSDRPLINKNVIKYLGVLFDNKLNWEQRIQHVLAKLCIARGVLMKLRHYVPVAALRNIYFGIVYSYLQYGVTSWGNAASKYTTRIQIQQNYIVKILTKTPFFRKKLLPIYSNLNLLKFNNVFNLEVLKFVFKFRSKTLPSCFNEYFRQAAQIHDHSTRFSSEKNLVSMRCSKSLTQRSIRYTGCNIWNNLPPDIKGNSQISYNVFVKKIKQVLRDKQC